MNEELARCLEMCLSRCEMVYRTGRSPADIRNLAKVWAEDFERELRPRDTCQLITECFRLWRLKSQWFPTPAQILSLIEDQRPAPVPPPEPEPDPEELARRARAVQRVRSWLKRLRNQS